MSTFILMKLFESAPKMYDWGIRLLSLGRLDKIYDRIVSPIKKADRVLDLGCGTGALSLRAAERGARVKGIDINARMLEVARFRASVANISKTISFSERGVAELDQETECYDVITAGLLFSELSEDEVIFALKEIKRILKPGGLLLIVDEVNPEKYYKRIFNGFRRLILGTLVYIFTQSFPKALKDLPGKLERMGFTIESSLKNKGENFIELVASKPKEENK